MYEKFAELCKQKNVRPADVARATGISSGTLTDWKKGRVKTLSIENIGKLAAYFGVTTDYFLDGIVREGYYIDPETAAYAQKLADDKAFRVLFDAAAGATPEDLERAAAFLRMLKATNPNG